MLLSRNLSSIFSSFRSGCLHHHLRLGFFLLWFWWLEESQCVLVRHGNAEEVRVEGAHDGSFQKEFEHVVFLIVFDVSLLGDSKSDENFVSLVAPNVVANSPESAAADGHDGEDAGGGELASSTQAVSGEPNHPEAGGEVHGDEQNNLDEWVPPDSLVIEADHKVPGDVIEGHDHGETSNQHHTALNWETAAAREVLGLISAARAKAATAGLKVFLVVDGDEGSFGGLIEVE